VYRVHDGEAADAPQAATLKFTRWQDVAGPLDLGVDTTSGDPRG
jgi:hypothetical protein